MEGIVNLVGVIIGSIIAFFIIRAVVRAIIRENRRSAAELEEKEKKKNEILRRDGLDPDYVFDGKTASKYYFEVFDITIAIYRDAKIIRLIIIMSSSPIDYQIRFDEIVDIQEIRYTMEDLRSEDDPNLIRHAVTIITRNASLPSISVEVRGRGLYTQLRSALGR